MELLETMKELRNKYTDVLDAPTLDGWEKKVKELMMKESIAHTTPIILLTESLRNEVKGIDHLLLNVDSKDLPDAVRDRMIDKKMLYLTVIGYFNVEQEREALENQLKNP